MPELVTVRRIQPAPVKRGGVIHQGATSDIYHADIIPGESIRLWGWNSNNQRASHNPVNGRYRPFWKWFSHTFRLGDWAEYDSYNFNYTGKIVAIGPKSVTIEGDGARKHRLTLYEFAWRNWDLDLDRIAKNNSDTAQCI